MILSRRRSSTKRRSRRFVVRIARRWVIGIRRCAMQASKSSMKQACCSASSFQPGSDGGRSKRINALLRRSASNTRAEQHSGGATAQRTLAGAAAVVLVPLSFLASQVGADFGKRLEKELWKKWSGPPTTRFLRHRNSEYNAISRELVHAKLKGFGLHVPTEREEKKDNIAADSHWEACTGELIRRTRNKRQYPLVFEGLVEYGYRRNLLGLRPFESLAK